MTSENMMAQTDENMMDQADDAPKAIVPVNELAQSHSKEPLTRAQMEAVIRGGGSVSIGHQIVTHIAHLPSEAELAKGDPAKEAVAKGNLQAQINALQTQLNGLAPDEPAVSSSFADDLRRQLGSTSANALLGAGYDSPEKLLAAETEDLRKINGVGEATITRLNEIKASRPDGN